MKILYSQSEFIEDVRDQLGKNKVQIIHNDGPKETKYLKEIFDTEDCLIVEVPNPPRGGEGSPLMGYIFLGLAIHIFITMGNSFFNELGKIMAQKLVRTLTRKKKPSQIFVVIGKENDMKSLSVLIPASCSDKEVEELLMLIDKHFSQSKTTSRQVIYEKSSKKFSDLYKTE